MKKFKFQLIVVIFVLVFFCNTFVVVGFDKVDEEKICLQKNNDFYFVQLADTHIRHKIYDIRETTKERLSTVIDHVLSFENKPAFIVITGDLTEWGASGITGVLNCMAFADCFYEKDEQLYADKDFTVPVYTTPGNHDYCFSRNLNNYNNYIDKKNGNVINRYNITYGDIKLFFMDSGPNHYFHPKYWTNIVGDGLYDCDIDWLENELSTCTYDKKIVLMHHPAINTRSDNGDMGGVIYRNREEFIELCETYNVDLVLAGHTHTSKIFDADEEVYNDYPINSSVYTTLYVQSEDCKQSINYRNISIQGDDIWLESSQEVELTTNRKDFNSFPFFTRFLEGLKYL
jgi:predicted MPP superfamily phosphohydrolase